MGAGALGLRRDRDPDGVKAVTTGDGVGPEEVPRAAGAGGASPSSGPKLSSRKESGGGSPSSGPRLPSLRKAPTADRYLAEKVQGLEALVEQQATCIRELQSTLSDVKRDGRRIVSVVQYNILASYLGLNTQPWFLYGADITTEQRRQVFQKYFERDGCGKPKNSWPAYAEGVLTPEQISQVNWRDDDFAWDKRKVRLVEELRHFDADVVSLVELDEPAYFEQCLGDQWDMIFHKRPRKVSLDGCGVFWRRSKFECVADHALDFVDTFDDQGRKKCDRSCLMVLLRWRHTSAPPLVVVSTHLAKDPEDRSQTALRVRQVTQIMEALTEFTTNNGAAEAPVVLCGDLNAKHFGEIRGIARTVWQMAGSQLHKFLWCASDVPTGPTSITKARQCRIDAVQYLSGQMEVVEVLPMPRLEPGEVIPSAEHPSDHFPVCVKFRMKDAYQTVREVARAWLECVAGREKVHPLTQTDLRLAFDFFDRDRSGTIHRHGLEEACCDLQSTYFSGDIQSVLLDCFPDHEITYDLFIKAYEVRLNHERIRSIGELECAFEYFAGGRKTIPLSILEEAFREITPISFSDEEVKEMIRRMQLPPGCVEVDVHSFCEVVSRASFPHRSCCRVRSSLEARAFSKRGYSKTTQMLQTRLEALEIRNRPSWGNSPLPCPQKGSPSANPTISEFGFGFQANTEVSTETSSNALASPSLTVCDAVQVAALE